MANLDVWSVVCSAVLLVTVVRTVAADCSKADLPLQCETCPSVGVDCRRCPPPPFPDMMTFFRQTLNHIGRVSWNVSNEGQTDTTPCSGLLTKVNLTQLNEGLCEVPAVVTPSVTANNDSVTRAPPSVAESVQQVSDLAVVIVAVVVTLAAIIIVAAIVAVCCRMQRRSQKIHAISTPTSENLSTTTTTTVAMTVVETNKDGVRHLGSEISFRREISETNSTRELLRNDSVYAAGVSTPPPGAEVTVVFGIVGESTVDAVDSPVDEQVNCSPVGSTLSRTAPKDDKETTTA